MTTKTGHIEDVTLAATDPTPEVQQHLASCPVCEQLVLSTRRFLGQVRTIALSLPAPEVPSTQEILGKVRARRAARRRHRVLAIAASLLLALVTSAGVLHDARQRETRRRDVADDALLRSLDNYDHTPDIGGLGTLVNGALADDTQG